MTIKNRGLGKFQPTRSNETIASMAIFAHTQETARLLLSVCMSGKPHDPQLARDLAADLLDTIFILEFNQTPERFLDTAIRSRPEIAKGKPIALKFIAQLTGLDSKGDDK